MRVRCKSRLRYVQKMATGGHRVVVVRDADAGAGQALDGHASEGRTDGEGCGANLEKVIG